MVWISVLRTYVRYLNICLYICFCVMFVCVACRYELCKCIICVNSVVTHHCSSCNGGNKDIYIFHGMRPNETRWKMKEYYRKWESCTMLFIFIVVSIPVHFKVPYYTLSVRVFSISSHYVPFRRKH